MPCTKDEEPIATPAISPSKCLEQPSDHKDDTSQDTEYRMSSMRRALFLASAERYSSIILNFLLIASVSRLLTPAEVGISAIGATIVSFTEAVRDSPSSYLVQKQTATEEDVRTAFTAMLAITVVIALGLCVSAPWLAAALRQETLAPFFYVMALGLLPACIERPIMALLRREMAFGTYASISVVSGLFALIVTVALAFYGAGFMCFAWGQLAGSASAAALALWYRPHFRIFRPLLSEMRHVLPFNGYSTIGAVLWAIYETVPYLILSRQLQFGAIGFFNRTQTICRLPDKLNTGLIALALPAFSAIAREGSDLAAAYLKATAYITVIEWPLRVLLVIFAYPVVQIILGPQWTNIAPLVQIMSGALIFAAPQILQYPVLVATGGVKDHLAATLVTWPVSIITMSIAAYFGIHMMVWAMLIVMPVQTAVGLYYVRRRIPFTARAYAAAIGPSALVTLCTAIGPLLMVLAAGLRFDLSVALFLCGGVLALPGWAAGVWLAGHPVKNDLAQLLSDVRSATRSSRIPIFRDKITPTITP